MRGHNTELSEELHYIIR